MLLNALIDTHAHCYVKKMSSSEADWIDAIERENIAKVLLPNIDIESIPMMHDLCEKYPEKFVPMMGLHPCDVDGDYENNLDIVGKYLSENPEKYCAVGEAGLDYHWDTTFAKEQKEALKRQMNWAIEYDKPIVLHSRKSNNDLIEILQEYVPKRLKAVWHCYTGSVEETEIVKKLGISIGLGGVLTYKNAKLDESIIDFPMDRIVLETDSPYLPPVPHRGKMNQPAYVRFVAEKLAEIKGVSVEDVRKITTENAIRIFDL